MLMQIFPIWHGYSRANVYKDLAEDECNEGHKTASVDIVKGSIFAQSITCKKQSRT